MTFLANTHDQLYKYLANVSNDDDSFLIVEEYQKKQWQILKYKNLNKFVADFTFDKAFYSLFYRTRRYLYIDIDHYVGRILDKRDILIISKEAVRILTNFINLYKFLLVLLHCNLYLGVSDFSALSKR